VYEADGASRLSGMLQDQSALYGVLKMMSQLSLTLLSLESSERTYIMGMEKKTTVLVDTLRFPESPRWHEGKLWVPDYFARRVMQVDLQGGVQTVVEFPDVPSALGWTPEGRLLVVSAMDRRLLRLEDDGLVEVADLSSLVLYPNNDMVVDGLGRAYIGNMGYIFGQGTPKPAPIVLVTPEGSARVVADGLAFPNGMVITPDGQTLIVAESHAARLTAFHIEPDGSLAHGRAWSQFEDRGDFGATAGQITPDGICLDADQAVWVASPNTREVLRVHEGAQITSRIALSTIPLACMLGGEGRRTLFIATTESLDPSDSKARGLIETIQVDVAGAGLP
jgi:sugar lactone lactonase YvrE